MSIPHCTKGQGEAIVVSLSYLALVTPLDKLHCIHLHGRLEVTYSDNLTYQGYGAYMVAANPFMDLFQDILGFLFVDAFQVRHGEASLIQGVI